MVKLKKWNSAEYIQTEEDIALYLQACIDETEYDTAYQARLFIESDKATKTNVNHAPNSGHALLHLLSSESFACAPKSNSQHLEQTVLANRNAWHD